MKSVLSFTFLLYSLLVFGQDPVATAAATVQQGLEQHQQMALNSPFKNLKFKNVGPTVMSGRVVDVDVNPTDPTEMLVAYASGGLWHSTNNGTSFTPIMDNAATINLGDIAVDWTTQF